MVFCADPELTEETGTLQQDAVILVTETRGKAARISYTVNKQNKQTAWVKGKDLILLSVATPTDLDTLIPDEDVQLSAPVIPPEETEEEPSDDDVIPSDEEGPSGDDAVPTEPEEPVDSLSDGESSEEPAAPTVIPGFEAPGESASGSFSAENGRQPRVSRGILPQTHCNPFLRS